MYIYTFKPTIVIERVAADSVTFYFPQGMQLIISSSQCIDLKVMYVMMMVVIMRGWIQHIYYVYTTWL